MTTSGWLRAPTGRLAGMHAYQQIGTRIMTTTARQLSRVPKWASAAIALALCGSVIAGCSSGSGDPAGSTSPGSGTSSPTSGSPTSSPSSSSPPGTTITWSASNIDPGLDLVSVSCPTTTDCVAVDADSGTSSDGGNAFTYNGTSWSKPVAVDADLSFASVSCPTTSFCAAVDDSGSAFVYNGSSWTAFKGIDPNQFAAVSCASALFCAAVDNNGGAVTWDGTKWSSPAAVKTSGEGLVSVSCPSASFCMATDGSGAFSFNGSSWSSVHALENSIPADYIGQPVGCRVPPCRCALRWAAQAVCSRTKARGRPRRRSTRSVALPRCRARQHRSAWPSTTPTSHSHITGAPGRSPLSSPPARVSNPEAKASYLCPAPPPRSARRQTARPTRLRGAADNSERRDAPSPPPTRSSPSRAALNR